MLVVVLKAWGIEMRRAAQGRRHMHRAAEPLKVAEKHLRKARPDIVRISPAGDFRRGCELVGHLSLVAEVRDPPDSTQALSMGVELTARLTDAALLLATGSEAHLAGLRAIAASRSMSLDDDGLRRDGKLVAASSEDSIYRAWHAAGTPGAARGP
jgi:DNA polymerase (family X)